MAEDGGEERPKLTIPDWVTEGALEGSFLAEQKPAEDTVQTREQVETAKDLLKKIDEKIGGRISTKGVGNPDTVSRPPRLGKRPNS